MIAERPRLLLEACLGSRSARHESWSRWLELTRFDDVGSASFTLLPSVAHLNSGEPLAEASRLKGMFRHNWASNQARWNASLPLLTALQEEGLDPVLIKGAALAGSVYGSLGARRMADIDVLVREKDFAASMAVAKRCGFVGAPGFAWPRAGVKSWAFYGPAGGEVDLHVRPLQSPWDEKAEDAMRAQPGQTSLGGRVFKTLSPSASVVVAILHGLAYDARASHQWILDVALLTRAGGVDWDSVEAIARMLDQELAVSRGLDTVRRLLPQGSIPPVLIQGPSRLAHRVELAFRTREPGGLLGALPNLYFCYLRERAAGLWRLDFGAFLRDTWQLSPESSLGPVLLSKSLRRAHSVFRPPSVSSGRGVGTRP